MVDGNAYELLLICSKPKSNSWQMKLKISIATGAVEPGDYGRASGDEYDEALSTLAELEDIGWKVRLCLMDTSVRSTLVRRRVYRVVNWSRRVKSCEISNPAAA